MPPAFTSLEVLRGDGEAGTFTVEPRGERALVGIDTVLPANGLEGLLLRLLGPRLLRPLYADELARRPAARAGHVTFRPGRCVSTSDGGSGRPSRGAARTRPETTTCSWLEHPEDTSMHTDSPSTEIVIVGGGLAGLTAAAYLARAGRGVTLFEKAPSLGGRAATQHQPVSQTAGTVSSLG